MVEWLNDFHFLRPHWLWALLAVAALALWQRSRWRSAKGWEQYIAPALLPLLTRSDGRAKSRLPLLAVITAGLVIGAAGPSWQRLPQPVEVNQSALVVILDLSPSLYAKDIAPSRLVRARFKLLDLLNLRQDGLTALVVYAGEAHVLSPLTEDTNTIAHLVPVLSPSLLVEIGSNLEDAVEQAVNLLQNSSEGRGDIILISDGATATAARASSDILAQHSALRLSILGVGTRAGAPIPLASGGFLKSADGAIVLPKLDSALLADLANRHRGIYRELSLDDSDIRALLAHIESRPIADSKAVNRDFDQWRDMAHWVAIILLLPLALSFRRGVLLLAVAVLLPSGFTPTAHAAQQGEAEPVSAGAKLAQGWQDFWWRRDQQAAHKLANGDAQRAAELFERRDWAATAAYRHGDYSAAVENFLADENAQQQPTALYNAATALARGGDLAAALATYNQLLALQPDHRDGRYNRDIVERLLEQQQQQQQEQQQQQSAADQQQPQGEQHDQNQQSQSQDQAGENQQNQQTPNQQSAAQQQQQQQPPDQAQAADQGDQQNNAEQQQTRPSQADQQQSDQATAGELAEQGEQSEQQAGLDAASMAEQQAAERELEQWLRKIDDDPAGLLRAKFRYQSQQRAREQKLRPPPNNNDRERW